MIWLVLVILAGGVGLAWLLDREARRTPPVPPGVVLVGVTRWLLVEPADPNNPTMAELNAGIDLTCFIDGPITLTTSTGEPR